MSRHLRLARRPAAVAVAENPRNQLLFAPEDASATPTELVGPAAFQSRVEAALADCRTSGRPVSCLILQIDGTDPDVTGLAPIHAAELIGDIARFLQESSRNHDPVSHYKPGRFAMLSRTPRGSAIRFADRLLTLIRSHSWRIADCHVDLLCSVGVSQANGWDDVEVLPRALDAASRAARTGQLVGIAA